MHLQSLLKYIMLFLLILRLKQLENDTDVYLTPLVENKKKMLWSEGVTMFDTYSQINFTLRVIIFCTINDFSIYGNMSDYTIKEAKVCPICEDETSNLWLSNNKFFKKMIMSHHCVFLPIDNLYRKKKNISMEK